MGQPCAGRGRAILLRLSGDEDGSTPAPAGDSTAADGKDGLEGHSMKPNDAAGEGDFEMVGQEP